MKHIKEYNEYIDPFNEDDWEDVSKNIKLKYIYK